MNQELKLSRMRVYYLEREPGLICSGAYRYELEKSEKIVSGMEKGNVTTDEVLRSLIQ
jgi:hypothetical protein